MRDWEPMDAAVFEMVEDMSMEYVIKKIILMTLRFGSVYQIGLPLHETQIEAMGNYTTGSLHFFLLPLSM